MTALVIVAVGFVVLVVIYVIETVHPEPDPDLASPDGWDPSTAWDSLWDAGHDR